MMMSITHRGTGLGLSGGNMSIFKSLANKVRVMPVNNRGLHRNHLMQTYKCSFIPALAFFFLLLFHQSEGKVVPVSAFD